MTLCSIHSDLDELLAFTACLNCVQKHQGSHSEHSEQALFGDCQERLAKICHVIPPAAIFLQWFRSSGKVRMRKAIASSIPPPTTSTALSSSRVQFLSISRRSSSIFPYLVLQQIKDINILAYLKRFSPETGAFQGDSHYGASATSIEPVGRTDDVSSGKPSLQKISQSLFSAFRYCDPPW